jgi:hypothetical protein
MGQLGDCFVKRSETNCNRNPTVPPRGDEPIGLSLRWPPPKKLPSSLSPLSFLGHRPSGPPCEPWGRFPNLSPLSIRQTTPVTRDHQTRRGSPDLCVRPLRVHPKTIIHQGPHNASQKRTFPHATDKFSNLSHDAADLCLRREIGFPTCLRWASSKKHPWPGPTTRRAAGARTSVSARCVSIRTKPFAGPPTTRPNAFHTFTFQVVLCGSPEAPPHAVSLRMGKRWKHRTPGSRTPAVSTPI